MERTYYISYFQLNYNTLEHPSPICHGWELVNGKYRSVYNAISPLPEKLGDIDSFNKSNDGSSDDERTEYRISSNSDEE